MATLTANALRTARSIICHDAMKGTVKLNQRIEVENSGHEVVYRLPFIDAVTIIHD